VRHRLLVTPTPSTPPRIVNYTPRIVNYTGRGPLGASLRIAAVRAARDLKRRAKPEVPLDAAHEDFALRSASPDPELEYVQRRYARDLRSAFESALSALPTRDRNILRHYFQDGMTTTAIGALFRVHGSTITRWVARARQAILDETRRRLRERLDLRASALESLVALAESRLDVSLHRLLAPVARSGRKRGPEHGS